MARQLGDSGSKRINYWKRDKLGRGRPPVYDNPEQLEEAIDKYFEQCFTGGDEDGNNAELNDRPSITGMALFLFGGRSTMHKYENIQEFAPLIKQAKEYVERFYESELFGEYFGGAKFALMQCGWKTQNKNENIEISTDVDLDDLNDE